MNTEADFKYASFPLSKETLLYYIDKTTKEDKNKTNKYCGQAYSIALIECIINSIACDNAEYNTKDTELFNILVSLVKQCGRNERGIYSKNAHIAMKKLCTAYGLTEDAIKLQDKKATSLIQKLGNKFKGLFSRDKKEVKEENKEKNKEANKNDNAKTQKSKRSFWHTVAVKSATITAGALTVLAMTCNSPNKTDTSDDKKNDKTETIKQTQNQETIKTIAIPVDTISQKAPQTDSTKIVAINNFCDSSLDILMGTKKRDALYKQIQNQVERGIFKIPEGMSVQRIAHAMEMSRIYEGRSIILDALKSDKNLTSTEQKAFEEHINGIGVRGEKLQQRMMKKQKLSSHSKFNHASYAQQQAHVKNLKQLRQLRGR